MGMPEVDEVAAPSGRRPVPWPAIGLTAALVLALLIGLGLLGELGPFIGAGFNVLPFVGLAVLAALGETRPWARWLAYGYLVLLGLGVLGFLAMLVFVVGLGGAGLANPRAIPPAVMLAASLSALGYLALGLVLLGLALLPLAPPVRRLAARWLPLDPSSVTQAVGLCTALLLTALPLAALLWLGGRPPLLTLLARLPAEAAGSNRPIDLIYLLIWMVPASLLLVGFPIRRGLGAALTRLGLVVPTGRQVALGLLVAVGLVGLGLGLDQGLARLFDGFGWPRTDSALFERLLAGLITPVGALAVGVSAGVGEELAVRGALQPRLGLLLANLAFTAAHAVQYGFDGLLAVFVIGLALGTLRARTNTTTSAIAHGGYDFLLVLAAALGYQ